LVETDGTAHRLIEFLHLPCGELKPLCVKKVTVDIHLENRDCQSGFLTGFHWLQRVI